MERQNSPAGKPFDPGRRSILKAGFSAGVAAAMAPVMADAAGAVGVFGNRVPAAEIEEATIADLSQWMTEGKETARSIAEKYIARIEAIDKSGPMLNSIIELNPDALAIADELDTERTAKGARGPMHGIPVLLKDNIDTADRMMTTAGSLAMVGKAPPEDAMFVRSLRRAGAVILGKTNLSEWANIRSNRSTSGWSGRGGLTKNPYVLDRNTSGSSSGSAVAVSANLCAVAVGTETDGSIVSPSSLNGIVGVKPTVKLISQSGIIPISHSQDTAGPMARSVRDAAILLYAMANSSGTDGETQASGYDVTPYAPLLKADSLHGARIGVVRKYFGFHPDVDEIIENALEVMRNSGAVLTDPVDIDVVGKLDDAEMTVLMYELKADMNAYLEKRGAGAPCHSLKDVIEFNKSHREAEMKYFGQELFLKAEAKGPLTEGEYGTALAHCRMAREEGIDAVMDKHRLDALVAPTDCPAWVTDVVCGDHFIGGSANLAAVAGCPSVTVPAGFVFGLPVGISFFGRAYTEGRLLALAYAFEQATHVRRKPGYAATVGVTVRE